jgi:hypothetical protein
MKMVISNKKDPVKKIMTLFYLLKFLKIKVNLNLKIWSILKAQNDTFYKKNLQNKTKNKVDNRKKEVDNLYKIDSKEKNNQLQTI